MKGSGGTCGDQTQDMYADMLYRERPVSEKHPPMSPEDRAAQFAPFAALTGYDIAIEQTAREHEVMVAEEVEHVAHPEEEWEKCLYETPKS